jgi:hypothetical protein
MKVTPAATPLATGASQPARPADTGFARLLGPAAGGAPQSAAAVAATASLGAVMVLQGGLDPDARARALQKGRRLVDALDDLRIALLSEGPTRRNLADLNAALADPRLPSGDAELDEAMNWVEIRAAVEAAKLDKQAA